MSKVRVKLSVFVVAGATLFGGCDCNHPPPPSIPTGCWSPSGVGNGAACHTGFDIEPNDTTSSATELPAATCGSQSVNGRLANDVDILHTSGPRCPHGSLPTVSVDHADPGLRTCMFVSCATGKAGIAGCRPGSETAPEHLPERMIGCCRLGPGEVTVEANCDSDFSVAAGVPILKPPNWHAWIVVDAYAADASATSCLDYSLAYHF